jgi:hypothetical protein
LCSARRLPNSPAARRAPSAAAKAPIAPTIPAQLDLGRGKARLLADHNLGGPDSISVERRDQAQRYGRRHPALGNG